MPVNKQVFSNSHCCICSDLWTMFEQQMERDKIKHELEIKKQIEVESTMSQRQQR